MDTGLSCDAHRGVHRAVRQGHPSTGVPAVDSYLDFVRRRASCRRWRSVPPRWHRLRADIENGFFDRLVSPPVSRVSILVGRLAGSAVFAGAQALVLILIFSPSAYARRRPRSGDRARDRCGVPRLAIGALGRTGLQRRHKSRAEHIPRHLRAAVRVSAFWPTALMKGVTMGRSATRSRSSSTRCGVWSSRDGRGLTPLERSASPWRSRR
jgi:hypothetical protein